MCYALKSVPTLCEASSAARSINKELAKDTESNSAVLFPVADVNHAAKKVFWSDDFLFFIFFSRCASYHIGRFVINRADAAGSGRSAMKKKSSGRAPTRSAIIRKRIPLVYESQLSWFLLI